MNNVRVIIVSCTTWLRRPRRPRLLRFADLLRLRRIYLSTVFYCLGIYV